MTSESLADAKSRLSLRRTVLGVLSFLIVLLLVTLAAGFNTLWALNGHVTGEAAGVLEGARTALITLSAVAV